MNKKELFTLINDDKAEDAADRLLKRKSLHALTDQGYSDFKDLASNSFKDVQDVMVVGSSNWRWSLNPNKAFSEHHSKSDIDTVIISKTEFDITWEVIREFHRKQYYTTSEEIRNNLNRNGVNIYCGFVTPSWLPERSSFTYDFKRILNKLSNENVGYKSVKILFFKNYTEVKDYYIRGIINAKRKLLEWNMT